MILGISILDFAIFSALIIVIATLSVFLFIVNRKRLALSKSLIVMSLEKESLLRVIEKAMEEKENTSVESTDGFLKFVSDSRTWAFDYIEQVQAALQAFKDKVDVHINYITKYGKVVEHPLSESIDVITEAYMELDKLLPADKIKRDTI